MFVQFVDVLYLKEEAICSECIYKLPKTRDFILFQDNKAQKIVLG